MVVEARGDEIMRDQAVRLNQWLTELAGPGIYRSGKPTSCDEPTYYESQPITKANLLRKPTYSVQKRVWKWRHDHCSALIASNNGR
jgi:hypothetical protein